MKYEGHWFRFVVAEFNILLSGRAWFFAVAYLLLYCIYSVNQLQHIARIEQGSINGWQVVALLISGPYPRAPVQEIIKWISIPAAFILVVCEPFSLAAGPWNRLNLVRMPDRRSYLTAKFMVWFLFGVLYTILFIGMGILVALLYKTAFARANSCFTLANGLINGPASAVMLWSFTNLLADIWWYITLFFLVSLLIERPGFATVITILVGYIVTVLGAFLPGAIPLFRPALGAILNSSILPLYKISPISFGEIALNLLIWLLCGLVAVYYVFRTKIL